MTDIGISLFMRAADGVSRTAQYHDLSYLELNKRASSREKLARDLQTVLTQSDDHLPTVQISNTPSGQSDDGLAANLDLAGAIGPARADVDFLLVKGKGPEAFPSQRIYQTKDSGLKPNIAKIWQGRIRNA